MGILSTRYTNGTKVVERRVGVRSNKNLGKMIRPGYAGLHLPVDIRRYIKGKVIDLSTATKYYRRCAESVRPRLRPVLEEKAEAKFELERKFFRFYMKLLRELVARNYARSEMKGADFLARALYRAGCLYAREQQPLDPSPFLLWPDTRPITDAWRRLGESGVPGGRQVVLEDPGPGQKLRLPRRGEFGFPRIRLSLIFTQDREKLPKLTIEIEGEPVCILMKGGYLLRDPEERRAVRKDSKRIWEGVTPWLLADLGIGQLKRGKPAGHLGPEAAYLHDHHGLSWTQIAEKVCPKKHTHDWNCKENLRTQARQFWTNQRRSAATLPLL